MLQVFDIIGPIMIGPSSSHTAGAVRIGKYARSVLGKKPVKAVIQFSGSFAKTYKGHGTDKGCDCRDSGDGHRRCPYPQQHADCDRGRSGFYLYRRRY